MGAFLIDLLQILFGIIIGGIIGFIIARKYIVNGVSRGGLKG